MPGQVVKTMQDDFWGWLYWLGHTLSLGSIAGVLLGLFTPFASLVALIFYLFQIYENKTFQRWLRNRRIKKMAKLKAKMLILETMTKADADNK